MALRLMTYNLEYDNADPEASLDAIAAGEADVVLLQEVDAAWQARLRARFAAVYPHQDVHLHARRSGGLAILSKWPIGARAIYASPTPGWFPAGRFVVATALGDVQLLNVHLRPMIDQGSWLRGATTTPKYRLAEITAYWPHLDPALPTVVAGDFNEAHHGGAVAFLEHHGLARVPTDGPPTWHYEQRVDGQLKDLLAFDIDHILVRGLVARDAHVLAAGASDHRPVVVTLER